METWNQVPQYPNYSASNLGRIKRNARVTIRSNGRRMTVPEMILTATPNKDGYLIVTRKKIPVHKLVALAFLGPRPEGLQVCHNDSNQLNNAVTNLRYDTPKSNTRDRDLAGGHRNGRKTHCDKGHEFTPDNTKTITKTGARQCRTCGRIRDARYRASLTV